jgi:superfamily I DNA/RNA helicase
VDEAQDLDPAMLRMLVGLCRTSDRLLLTADPNQSIYGSGFRWADVHADLRFRGRTGVLRRNYRSTAQISLAARSYLAGAELDEHEGAEIALEHIRSGPRPVASWVKPGDELAQLVAYVREATREARTGLGSCAVLVPTHAAAEGVARRLNEAGLPAAYMPGRAIDLQTPAVKIVTLQSSKGLEFPIVALARLAELPSMGVPTNAGDEERDEAAQRHRRILYVAMTRAMQSLLVLLPAGHPSPLFQGFDASAWALEPATR